MFRKTRWNSVMCTCWMATAWLIGCGGVITPPVINQNPIADGGSNQSAQVGSRVTLSALGSVDPDDDALTYIWQQTSGPSVELQDANGVQASFVPSEDGIYLFTLNVTDDRGGSDVSMVQVFVGNVPMSGAPYADAGLDQSVFEGDLVTLRGQNSADPEGGPLDSRWLQLEGPQVSLSSVFATQPTFVAPTVDVETVLVFELTVTDEDSLSSTGTVAITVRDGGPDRC